MHEQWTGLTQHAIGRDLDRTRSLLATQMVIGRDQRHAVARHLVWMMALIRREVTEIAEAAEAMERAAHGFFRTDGRTMRRDVLVAINRLHEELCQRDAWISPEMLPLIARQAHWLVDGMDARATEHLTRRLMPRSALAQLRMRADVYRYRKTQLWGHATTTTVPAVTGRRVRESADERVTTG